MGGSTPDAAGTYVVTVEARETAYGGADSRSLSLEAVAATGSGSSGGGCAGSGMSLLALPFLLRPRRRNPKP